MCKRQVVLAAEANFLSRLEKHLKANEKVIWSGKPVKKEFVMPTLKPPLHEEKKGSS